MKYKVIKNFEARYLSNDIFEGQETLMDVSTSLKFKIDDIIEFSDNPNGKFVKLNGDLIDESHSPCVQYPIYYVNEGIFERIG